MAVSTFGNNIVGAFTGGVPVTAIYMGSTKVWPTGSGMWDNYLEWNIDATGEIRYPYSVGRYYSTNLPINPGSISSWVSVSYYSTESYARLYCVYPQNVIFGSYNKSSTTITRISGNAERINFYVLHCSLLSEVNFPNLSVWDGGITSCYGLTSVYMPNIISLPTLAFYNCINLPSITLQNCEYLNEGTFSSCLNLSYVSCPKISYVGGGAFLDCRKLEKVYFPSCLSVAGAGFENCLNLVSVSLPVCSYIGGNAFNYCEKLTDVDIPLCEVVSGSAFTYCESLSYIELPACKTIGAFAFAHAGLEKIELMQCNEIYTAAFLSCSSLSEMILSGSRVISLSSGSYSSQYEYYNGAFYDTPLASGVGHIYVPSSLVSAYKTAPGWSSLSSVIHPINN